MYSKLYSSIFNGSLFGKFEALTTFMTLIALADWHGEVDASHERIAANLGCEVDFVRRGIEQLMAPDPASRTPAEEGRRIVPLLNDEGQPRAFGWRIVNYLKYRAIRDDDERRAYQREWDRINRAGGRRKRPTASDKIVGLDRIRPNPTHTDTDTNKNLKPIVGLAPDGARHEPAAPTPSEREQARESAKRAIEYLNEKAGTSYPLSKANLKLPMARLLHDGATESDLCAVVDSKVAEAAHEAFDRRYLRPATLWNAEKFAQYIGQITALSPAAQQPAIAKVYTEAADGKQALVGEYPSGEPEQLARRALDEYGTAPWMQASRNLIVKTDGQAAARFAITELRSAP